MRTLCQTRHMACLRLHHATNNASRVGSHDGWCIVQGLFVGYKKKQTVVLSIFEVSEHDNQPELEHELLPQYVIDTGEHDGTVCFFRNDILQYETATRNMSSAEDRSGYMTLFLNGVLYVTEIMKIGSSQCTNNI